MMKIAFVGPIAALALALASSLWRGRHPLPHEVLRSHAADLDNRTVIVTGANAGVGLETTIAFVTAGADVIMACRSQERCSVAAEIVTAAARARAASSAPSVTTLQLDLEDPSSIKNFAAMIVAMRVRVHILVLNAGVTGIGWMSVHRSPATGHERRWSTNHLGHHYLTTLLRQPLVAASHAGPRPARIIVVASQSHKFSPALPLDAYQLPTEAVLQRPFIPVIRDLRLYAFSKLCNVLFAKELQRRWGDDILAVSLHPGSSMLTNGGESILPVRLWLYLIQPWTKTPEQGASTTVYAAVAQGFKGGEYLSDCQVSDQVHADASNALKATLLWNLTEQAIQAFP